MKRGRTSRGFPMPQCLGYIVSFPHWHRSAPPHYSLGFLLSSLDPLPKHPFRMCVEDGLQSGARWEGVGKSHPQRGDDVETQRRPLGRGHELQGCLSQQRDSCDCRMQCCLDPLPLTLPHHFKPLPAQISCPCSRVCPRSPQKVLSASSAVLVPPWFPIPRCRPHLLVLEDKEREVVPRIHWQAADYGTKGIPANLKAAGRRAKGAIGISSGDLKQRNKERTGNRKGEVEEEKPGMNEGKAACKGERAAGRARTATKIEME